MLRSFFVLVFIVSLSFSSHIATYAMGGAPAPKQYSTSAPSSTPNAREEELNKARLELNDAKSELERVERYIWVLDSRIVAARIKGDAKKLVDLKEIEQTTLERAQLLKGTIARIKDKYPELKASEDLQTVNEKVTIPEPVVQEGSPVPAVAPVTANNPNPSNSVIIHEVQAGDTLMNISRKYYGTPSMYKEIMRINNLTESTLSKGMKLKIDLRSKLRPQPPAL